MQQAAEAAIQHSGAAPQPDVSEEAVPAEALPEATEEVVAAAALPEATEEVAAAEALPEATVEVVAAAALLEATEEVAAAEALPEATEEVVAAAALLQATEEVAAAAALPEATVEVVAAAALLEATEEVAAAEALPEATEEVAAAEALPEATEEVAADSTVVMEFRDALFIRVLEGVAGDKVAAAETACDARDNSSISTEGGNDAAQQLACTDTAEDALVISAMLGDLISAVEEGVAGDKEAAAETVPAACDSSTSEEGVITTLPSLQSNGFHNGDYSGLEEEEEEDGVTITPPSLQFNGFHNGETRYTFGPSLPV